MDEVEVAASNGTSQDELVRHLELDPELVESLLKDAEVRRDDWRLTLLFTPR